MKTRARILKALGDADGYVSGERLANEIGVSRAAVWKHIAALKRDGYSIRGVRSRGYRLIERPDRIGEAALGAALETRWLGRNVVVHETTGSTNSDAWDLARAGADEGTAVIADRQTAGRGRLGRSWQSEPGLNLYLSVVLRPEFEPARAPQLSLVAGVAVADVVDGYGVDCSIKWPNDVVVGRRKVAGVLTEIEAETDRIAAVVLGIGVNLNACEDDFAEELRPIATSVRMETGAPVDRLAFTAALLARLETAYEAFVDRGFAALAPAWEKRSLLTGREVAVAGVGGELRGQCVGIDSDGALLLERDGAAEPERVLAGDVTVIGGYGT